MKPQCARTWQVEAARDGRLKGKDLESALRHRAKCADCASEARAIAELGQRIAKLPDLPRDSLTAHRSRHRLMAAMNDVFLESGQPKPARRRAFFLAFGIVAIATVAASWVAVRRRSASPGAEVEAKSMVEVHADPGARWSERVDEQLDRVVLSDGAASFTVHPHPGRRVVVQLPDGELEDTGTVFQIRVNEERTLRISVSEGRVAVRLRERAEFSLTAGQAWESEPSAPMTTTAADAQHGTGITPQPTQSPEPSSLPRTTPVKRQGAPTSRETAAQRAPTSTLPPLQSANAEDEAYLHIVDLLRQDKPAEARAQAKAYLLRFPNGFRRVEVLNIATRAADPGDASAAH